MFALFLLSEIIVLAIVQYNSEPGLALENTGDRNWFFSRDPNDIRFYLYRDPTNPDAFSEIGHLNSTSLEQSGYDGSLPVVFLIHGLLANTSTASDVQQIKNAYLSVKFPANIIMVDYGELSGTNLPAYASILNLPVSLFANSNAPIVGQRVAEFIRFLIRSGVLPGPNKVHLVGFSLGCHVSGAAGTQVKRILNAPIARISGLDCPGGQIFSSNLLDKSDAEFVDVTHTSLGRISGVLGEIGHVDYFMNGGGPTQPNCKSVSLASDVYCTHVSSVYYFAKSIRNREIKGCKCQICAFYFSNCPSGNSVVYGQYISLSTRGKVYVKIA